MPATRESFGRRIRTIKHSDLFLVDDVRGNVPPDDSSGFGLYLGDTRVLNRLEIALNGTLPTPLLSSTERGYLSSIVYTNGPLTAETRSGAQRTIAPETLQVKRETLVFDRMYDRFFLANYGDEEIRLELTLALAADFLDMFEVRGIVEHSDQDPRPEVQVHEDRLVYSVRDRAGRHVRTEVRVRHGNATITCHGDTQQIVFSQYVPPRQPFLCELEIVPSIEEPESNEAGPSPSTGRVEVRSTEEPGDFDESLLRQTHRLRQWNDHATEILSDNEDFNELIIRAGKDIHMLMTRSPGGRYIAAGIPWFVALFGRDSIITSLFCLPYNADIARDTLEILARYQGTKHDPGRNEEPGKILHELRVGHLARLGEIPHTPYYGSVDSTPLWIILLHEYYRWTGDLAMVHRLWPNAMAALDWCERNMQDSANGYCIYDEHPHYGIVQQGWKDSNDSVMYADGTVATPPIALCEVQSYVYQARIAMMELAREVGQLDRVDQLSEENKNLFVRFNRDFWIRELDFCALGIDASCRTFGVISSNAGHCLESGILTDEHARFVGARLMEPDMFNGWGIRTLSCEAAAYNPMSYHNGSVWPHDNAMIARGMARMGQGSYVERIFSGLFNASRQMVYRRLPELFCGFERSSASDVDPPVRYPVACIPQAWAAASVYSLVQSTLNMTAHASQNSLAIRSPRLPIWLNQLTMRNLRVGEARVDLEFRRSRRTVTVDVTDMTGDLDVHVEIAARRDRTPR